MRRRIIADRYRPLIDGLYSDAGRASIEIEVTFEDGRKGTLAGDLEIQSAETILAEPPPLKQAS